jgi:DnaJ family protein C protein 19
MSQDTTSVPKIDMTTIFLAGLGIAGAALAGRAAVRALRTSSGAVGIKSPKTFYLGSFEDTMSKREASLILGVKETANSDEVKEAHRRLMRINHPDIGGSVFLGTKINLAKQVMEQNQPGASARKSRNAPSA